LLHLLGQAVDEGGAFIPLSGEFLYFLLVVLLVVIESVLDGEDVLVDGYSVPEKLSVCNCTFSSWSI
jgi:hypothetical protein